jgi:hypothetical protein
MRRKAPTTMTGYSKGVTSDMGKQADIKVGQKVYVIDRHYRRGKADPPLKEAVVSKVGRKYFYVDITSWRTERFRLNDLSYDDTEYVSHMSLYLSRQDYIDECQYDHLFGEIRNRFMRMMSSGCDLDGTVDLDQLRKIAAILGIEEMTIKDPEIE